MLSIISRRLVMVRMVLNQIPRIRLSLWTSAMLKATKPSFKLLNNGNLFAVVMLVEAPGTCGLLAPCANRSNHDVVVFHREPASWFGAGKRRLPVGAGCPAGEELSSVEPLGGRVEQGLSQVASLMSPQRVDASQACWSSRRQ